MSQALEDPRPRRLQPVAGRVPPHNLEAEESVLGAMLLSRDAIAAALECCSAEDFYKPAHVQVFAAITSLYTRGEPADPVTVADELRRSGAIGAVGDPSLLVSLQVNTPSTANAGHYARIVEEHALLRRLVTVAGEIAELGYSVPEDVTEVVDRAETLVFEVAQRRVVDTLSPLRDLLAASLDHLEHLYEREETITGVPTGYVDLDERLAGLQPSNLVVVGARPAMGKALALDTPVPTPTGWTTMGALQSGDLVHDEHGRPCRVRYVSPVFTGHRCYRVRFDDGATIVADAGHRWLAYDDPGWRALQASDERIASGLLGDDLAGIDGTTDRCARVVTTEQMRAEGLHTGDGRPNWYLPMAGALDGPDVDFPVDPYALGWWLAAGIGGQALEVLGDDDAAEVVAELEHSGYWLTRHPDGRWAATPIACGGPASAARPAPMWRDLAGELRAPACAEAADGRIPSSLLRASVKQRLALLQGIMDARGSVVGGGGEVVLRLADPELLAQVSELVHSLGHKLGVPGFDLVATAGDGHGATAPAGWWRLRWTPADPVFRLPSKAEPLARAQRCAPRQAEHARRAVVAVDEVPSEPVRCIAVDSPSHLFLAGRAMVPTHNTSFALGIVNHAAVTTKKPVLLFSLEMSHLELTQRMLCSEARVDATRMRNGRLLDSDWPKISDAIGRLGDAPIFIDDNPNVTVMDIRAKARRLMAREGLGLVVIDYLQLMTGRNRAESRQVEVSEISRGLKILARELNVPVIALSQLSRSLEMRQDKRPVLADLRESGSIEQDADVVLFIYRDEVYNPDSEERGTAEIIISKHRNGPVGNIQLAFVDHYTRFANMARV